MMTGLSSPAWIRARGPGSCWRGLIPRVMHRPRRRRSGIMLPGFFQGVKQYILHLLLSLPPEHNQLVNRIPGNDMIQEHRPGMTGLSLTRRADTLNDLLVLFQIPPMGEKNQNMTAVLKVKPMASGCRVSE